MYPAWDSLKSLNLWLNIFHQFGRILTHHIFKCCFCPFSLFLLETEYIPSFLYVLSLNPVPIVLVFYIIFSLNVSFFIYFPTLSSISSVLVYSNHWLHLLVNSFTVFSVQEFPFLIVSNCLPIFSIFNLFQQLFSKNL